jgi:hypothetical protein
MESINISYKKEQGNIKGFGIYEQHQRCELCNVPIFRNPCCDARSIGVLKGRGKILCNKCAAMLVRLPVEQANQALNNASKIYSKNEATQEKWQGKVKIVW